MAQCKDGKEIKKNDTQCPHCGGTGQEPEGPGAQSGSCTVCGGCGTVTLRPHSHNGHPI